MNIGPNGQWALIIENTFSDLIRSQCFDLFIFPLCVKLSVYQLNFLFGQKPLLKTPKTNRKKNYL